MNFEVNWSSTNYSISEIMVCEFAARKLDILKSIFKKFPLATHAIGDFGSFAVVVLLARQTATGEQGATLAAISSCVEPKRIATARRVRAILEWLCHCGGAVRGRHGSDRRHQPFFASGWLWEMVMDLSAEVAFAIQAQLGLASVQHAKEEICKLVTECLCDFLVSDVALPDEIAIFADYRGGYVLLLELLANSFRLPSGQVMTIVSRKASARVAGVSRAQLTAIVARAERLGMVQREAGEAILIRESFHQACVRFFSLQLEKAFWLVAANSS